MKSRLYLLMRKRRRWLLLLIPVVPLAFGWWSFTREPPLPKFLQKFEGQATLLWSGRTYRHITGMAPEESRHPLTSYYLVDAPAETVILSLADSNGRDPISLNDTGAHVFGFFEFGMEIDAVVRNGKRQTRVRITDGLSFERPYTMQDRIVLNLWPDWLGRLSTEPNFADGPDLKFDPLALRKARPRAFQ